MPAVVAFAQSPAARPQPNLAPATPAWPTPAMTPGATPEPGRLTCRQPLPLLEVTQLITRQTALTTDLAQIFVAAVDAMQQHLAYERVAIHLVDTTNQHLTLCAAAGVPLEQIPPTDYHLPFETSTPGQAVRTNQVAYFEHLAARPDRTALFNLAAPTSELSAPIRQDHHPVGALTVSVTRPARLEKADGDCLTFLAEQLAAAIRSTDLYRAQAERAARESLLTDLSRALNSSLELQPLLTQVVATVGERLKADRCHISQVHLNRRTVLVEHEYLNPLLAERRAHPKTLPFTADVEQMAQRLHTGQVLVATEQQPSALPSSLWTHYNRRYSVRSLISLPLLTGRANFFYLLTLMQVTHARVWSQDDLGLLHGIADQLALALRNAELFDASQRTAAALKTKNAELETFVYTVSHDLQTPVVSLNGFATLLQKQYAARLDERGLAYLARIAANTEFLNRLLQELLELSRVGRLEAPDETIAVGQIVEQTINDLANQLAERPVRLVQPAAWPTVRYSPVRLRQVFANLLSNAIKFMGTQPEPVIKVGWRPLARALFSVPPTAAPAQLVEFFVKDNGIGIAPDDQERIFLPFERLKKVEAPGSGIGLSIVKRIIESRGGALRVESAPGAGAAFYFTIPLPPEAAPLPPGLMPPYQEAT